VRVILEGRRYFEEKFGVQPPVAFNFDSFGHPSGLPQILHGSAFKLYLHCRPNAAQMDLPAPLYRWRGKDGAEVIALRPHTGWYCTPRPGQAQEQARNGIEFARATGQDALVLWGLGDHGGGATRDDLERFRELIAETAGSGVELRHSTPEAYLARIIERADKLPVYEGELQRTLSGTYTSVASIKRAMRDTEARLASAERWAALAWWYAGIAYPAADLRTAWKRLMLNTFHDTLCGSLLEGAIPGVQAVFGHAGDLARQITVRSQHALLPDISPEPETVPIYVFNPHAIPLRAPVGLNILSAYAPPPDYRPISLYDDTGTPVCHQEAGGPSVLQAGTWQPFVGFTAEVPPLSVRRYVVRFEPSGVPAAGELSTQSDESGITVKNRWWEAHFARQTAALESLIQRSTGKNLLKGPVQLCAMQDVSHAWGGENRVVYNVPVSPLAALTPAEVGAFAGVEGQQGPALRVIHAGPVSITVEGLVGWQHTRAAVQITFYADLPYLDAAVRLYMGARRKMIKLVLPFDLPDVSAVCEVPYGTAHYPADATEYPYGRWIRLEAPNGAVAIANNGQSGFDLPASGTLGLSLSRGATHCSWEGDPGGPAMDPAQSYTFMDQEQIDTRFRLVGGSSAQDVAAQIIPAALELNQPLERFHTYFPPTPPAKPSEAALPFLQISPSSVALGALKKAETEDALIVRLVEMTGQPVTAEIALAGGTTHTLAFRPNEILTFKIRRTADGVTWQPCNLLEH